MAIPIIKIFIVAMAFTFAVGLSVGARRRRAQLGLKQRD